MYKEAIVLLIIGLSTFMAGYYIGTLKDSDNIFISERVDCPIVPDCVCNCEKVECPEHDCMREFEVLRRNAEVARQVWEGAKEDLSKLANGG